MSRITFTADEKHESIVEEVEAEEGVESRAEAVRRCITRYANLQKDVEELRDELDRVKEEKRLILDDREERQELVKYVKDERTAEQRMREAGILTRTRWRLFGMDTEEE
jgi:hypothetical protein